MRSSLAASQWLPKKKSNEGTTARILAPKPNKEGHLSRRIEAPVGSVKRLLVYKPAAQRELLTPVRGCHKTNCTTAPPSFRSCNDFVGGPPGPRPTPWSPACTHEEPTRGSGADGGVRPTFGCGYAALRAGWPLATSGPAPYEEESTPGALAGTITGARVPMRCSIFRRHDLGPGDQAGNALQARVDSCQAQGFSASTSHWVSVEPPHGRQHPLGAAGSPGRCRRTGASMQSPQPRHFSVQCLLFEDSQECVFSRV